MKKLANVGTMLVQRCFQHQQNSNVVATLCVCYEQKAGACGERDSCDDIRYWLYTSHIVGYTWLLTIYMATY